MKALTELSPRSSKDSCLFPNSLSKQRTDIFSSISREEASPLASCQGPRMGQVMMASRYQVPNTTLARHWDFDLTVTDFEHGHHLSCELAAEELLTLNSRTITHNRWKQNFQPAFGLPTEVTSERIASILQTANNSNLPEHQIIKGRYEAFEIHNAELLHSLSAAQLIGTIRQETLEMFFKLAKLHLSRSHTSTDGLSAKLVLTNDKNEIDVVIDQVIEKRRANGLIALNGLSEDQLRTRKLEQIGILRGWKPELLPHVWETLEAAAVKGEVQNLVSSSDSWILEQATRAFGIRDKFAVVVGADHVERRKPDPLPHFTALQILNEQRKLQGEQTIPHANIEVMEDSASGYLAAVLFNPERDPILRIHRNGVGRFVRDLNRKLDDWMERCIGAGKYAEMEPAKAIHPELHERFLSDAVQKRLHMPIPILPCWSGVQFTAQRRFAA